MSESSTSYYINGFLRKNNATEAKEYLEADPTESITLTPSDAPANPQLGQIYYDQATGHFMGYNGGWVQLD